MPDKPKKKKQNKPQKQQTIKSSSLQKKTFIVPSWAIYAVLLLVALIYIRALFNGFASLDDDQYLFKNPFIKNFNFEAVKSIFSSFYLGNYHPLTTLTFLFEYHIYGLNPLPYHVLNVLLHLLNVLLVYKLIEKLSGNKLTALIVASLFAIHPMHVESVAWISERKDVLYTLFYLIALQFYLNYMKAGFKGKNYWICLLLFIFSLLSKSAAVTLPVLMLAFDFYKKRELNAKMFLEKLPFLAVSVLFGILALMSQQEAIKDVSVSFSYFDRIFLFTYTVAFYLIKLVAPFYLSVMHYYPEMHIGNLPWFYYASLPFLIFIVWLVVRRTSFRREKLFGVFFFLIVISIMLQIISVGNAITAERYTYVAYIGLFYIAGQWISNNQKVSLMKFALFVCGLFFIMFSYLSWERISVWKDGNVLFTDVIKKYPDSYHAYWMRGNYKSDLKNYQGALQDYNKTLELYPKFVECLTNRGHILNELNDYQAALRDLNLSIKLDSTVAEAYNNRGMSYDGLRDTAAAMDDYNKAIKLDPELQKAYNNRGVLKANIGNPEDALADINKAISMNPDDGEAYSNRANIKAMLKDFKGSIEDYSAALKINPNDNIVLFNRGLTRLNLNDTAGACVDWNRASELGNAAAAEVIKRFCR